MPFNRLALATTVVLTLGLAACDDRSSSLNSRHLTPIPAKTVALMAEKGMSRHDPVLIRSFKKESELEIWKRTKSGEYALLKTYPMCRWSGQLGPKIREGDRQAPEGFYAITPAQMNPNSSFYLSFNMGYPNAFDRAYGRSGSHLMVHGACSSRGCYSMTDEQIAEIYAIVRDAHAGGQQAVQMQALPFRMTPKNLALHRADPNMPFWANLKEGSDHFEVTKDEPKVAVCGKRYVFNATPQGGARMDAVSACPPLEMDESIAQAVAQKQRQDKQQVAELITSGTQAIKLVYSDGDQHHSFKQTVVASSSADDRFSPVVEQRNNRIGDVSRPEALAAGPVEIALDDNGRPKATPAPAARAETAVAAAPAPAAVPSAAPAVQVANQPAVAGAPVAASSALALTATPSSEPFYKRVLSPFRGLLGSTAEPAAAATIAGEPVPATAPMPPRRASGAAPKPQASAPADGRYMSLPAR